MNNKLVNFTIRQPKSKKKKAENPKVSQYELTIRQKLKKFPIGYLNREYDGTRFALSPLALRDLAFELSIHEIRFLFRLILMVEKNTNIILNNVGMPALTKKEIIDVINPSAKGYIERFIKLGIIARAYNEELQVQVFYFNPYILKYGGENDIAKEEFQDNRWNPNRCI